jgi:hypothetical protein
MINLELAHFIAKFFMIFYFVCFLLSLANKHNNKSNFIAITFALIFSVLNQYIKQTQGFYTFYLVSAVSCLFYVLLSLITHLLIKIKHVKTTVYIYFFYILIALSYLGLHRVRVIIFDSDEHILWVINTQSVFTLILYFLCICVFVYGSKILWKSQFGRLSSLF